jgi:hypothetical protein
MSYSLVALALALLLPACSSTWSRPATSFDDFRLDDRACRHMNTRTVLISPPLARDYVAPDGYRRCMEEEGYLEGGSWEGQAGWILD